MIYRPHVISVQWLVDRNDVISVIWFTDLMSSVSSGWLNASKSVDVFLKSLSNVLVFLNYLQPCPMERSELKSDFLNHLGLHHHRL